MRPGLASLRPYANSEIGSVKLEDANRDAIPDRLGASRFVQLGVAPLALC
jgi:hypothetical protein